LLEQDGANQSDDAGLIGEDGDDIGAPLTSLLRRSCGLVLCLCSVGISGSWGAELNLLGIDPQFDVVQDDIERLAAKAKRLLEQLKASPEHYEEFKGLAARPHLVQSSP